jgi:WD40 repeat protein
MRSLVALSLIALLGAAAAEQKTGSAETVLQRCYAPVTFLRFSPGGGDLARVCGVAFRGPKVATLFDTRNYTSARTFPNGLRVVAFSPDGTRAATAETEDGARVWDLTRPGTVQRRKAPGGDPAPVGFLLEREVLRTPLRVLEQPTRDPGLHVLWAGFSPDGRRLVTTHRNGQVRVWDATSWTAEEDFKVASGAELHSAAIAPDSGSLLLGDSDGTLHQWSFAGKSEVRTTPTGKGPIAALELAPDGKLLVSTHPPAGHWSGGNWVPPPATAEAAVMIWRTDTWEGVTKRGFATAAFSPDGKVIALGGSHVALIDAATLKEIRTADLRQPTGAEWNGAPSRQPAPVSVLSLAFSPDGSTLAAGCEDGTVHLLKITPKDE